MWSEIHMNFAWSIGVCFREKCLGMGLKEQVKGRS